MSDQPESYSYGWGTFSVGEKLLMIGSMVWIGCLVLNGVLLYLHMHL